MPAFVTTTCTHMPAWPLLLLPTFLLPAIVHTAPACVGSFTSHTLPPHPSTDLTCTPLYHAFCLFCHHLPCCCCWTYLPCPYLLLPLQFVILPGSSPLPCLPHTTFCHHYLYFTLPAFAVLHTYTCALHTCLLLLCIGSFTIHMHTHTYHAPPTTTLLYIITSCYLGSASSWFYSSPTLLPIHTATYRTVGSSATTLHTPHSNPIMPRWAGEIVGGVPGG